MCQGKNEGDEADKLSDNADRNKRAKRQNAILLSHFCFLASIYKV